MKFKATIPLVALTCLPGAAMATGFALTGQNASGLGNAFAGQAASAQDASTVFYNPAGLLRIEGQQAVVVGHLIQVESEFTGSNGVPSGGDAGGTVFVPNFYYATDAGPGFKFGLGINSPFGLKSEYDAGWVGQNQALLSEIKTINVNPSLAWLYNDRIAVGAGLNYQRVDATLTDAAVRVEGDDDAWGYNLGVLVRLDNDNRVGLAYRSQIKYHLEGTANGMQPIAAQLTTPASASVSWVGRLNGAWEVLADLSWMGWSAYDKLEVRRLDGTLVTSIPGGWRDTLRLALGANYHAGKRWLWRTGVAFDQSPVPDAQRRSPRIPDAERIWLAFGGQYRLTEQGWVDIGYAHLFVRDARIEQAPVSGRYQSRADLVSVQYTQSF